MSFPVFSPDELAPGMCYVPGWSQARDLPASSSQVPGLQTCVAMPGVSHLFVCSETIFP